MKDMIFLRLLNRERLLKELLTKDKFTLKYEYDNKKRKWNVFIPFLFFRKHYKIINLVYEADSFLENNPERWELIEDLPYCDNNNERLG